jgi:NADH-quinone oxidoreductase subunit L
VVDLVWLIPALPLLGFLTLVFLGRRIGEPVAGWLASAMVAGSFVTAVIVFFGLVGQPEDTFHQTLFTWISVGDFRVEFGFLLDPLSMAMILFITFISTMIHVYSIGYMHGDPRFPTFFTYLNLFVFAMLILVLGDNLLMTFLGWEGVGACSYFLIAFWFESDANASAAKKAFVTNRVGDWGFLVATFVSFFTFGSISYAEILPAAPGLAVGTATIIAVMFFVGAVGKSAQIPLFIWLPDAMAGPTPVSALIHAATMVTAGVYLMVRINPILAAAADWVPDMIAWVGVLTALLAATIAIAQKDIKKVLAYSTVSQIGYMMLAVGSGAYAAAIFHMITHAFFKALLFLSAGSVIHGMSEEQDMRLMGALRKAMPVTAGCMMVGWLAISGVPPFSGFWSKDEILSFALQKNPVLYGVGLFTALLTAFYMSREIFLVFFGKARWNMSLAEAEAVADGREPVAVAGTVITEDGEMAFEGDDAVEAAVEAATLTVDDPDAARHGPDEERHPHESPKVMTYPLIVLAVGAGVGGFLNLPFHGFEFLTEWLEPVVGENEAVLGYSTVQILLLLGVSTVVALVGVFLAYAVYLRHQVRARAVEPELFEKGWYYDLAISRFMGGPGEKIFDAFAWFDRTVIDGIVNGVGGATRRVGQGLRHVQTGYVRSYALGLAAGTVLLLAFLLTRVLRLS